MNLCFRFLFLLLTVLTINSCSNEIDVLADYEENASVYALLDPNQTWQFIKINKVFVNPNSKAKDVAKLADSLYFDTISPFLIENESGRRIPLFKANIALKDSGIFANSPNYLYVTNERIFEDNSYRLEFNLPQTGKLVSASTNVVNTPFVVYPVSFSQRALTVPQNASILLQFAAPKKGKIYDAYLYFNYTEINKFDTSQKTDYTIKWKILRSYRSLSDKGNEFVSQRISSSLFYDLLLSNIKPNVNVIRKFRTNEFELVSGNLELDNYIQASTPSIGIVQKQSEYTNILNGVGIFASRNTFYLDNIVLSELTKNVIVSSPDYKPLGFVK
ncbi:MAG: hypothetical protein R2852_01215 [Bacteroidia bacterium]